LLNGVIVTSGSTAPTVSGRSYATLAVGLAQAQLLHWTFIGPFDDAHFTARERAFGPEVDLLDYNQTFADGAGRTLRWQPVEVLAGTAAPTGMLMPVAAAAASINRTVGAVVCTHISVPAASPGTVDVLLVGSTSALATIMLNNQTVFDDRLITGLLLDEFSVPVTLPTGGAESVLCVKVYGQMTWATPWTMALSVTAPSGGGAGPEAVPGLRSKP
jgi:hypothetical protein